MSTVLTAAPAKDDADAKKAKKVTDAWRGWRDGKPVFKVSELAVILDISLCSAWTAVNDGRIGHVNVGRRVLIPRHVIEKLLSAA